MRADRKGFDQMLFWGDRLVVNMGVSLTQRLEGQPPAGTSKCFLDNYTPTVSKYKFLSPSSF